MIPIGFYLHFMKTTQFLLYFFLCILIIGCEDEGTINYNLSLCHVNIKIDPDNYQAFIHNFVCESVKTWSNKLVFKKCCNVTFLPDGTCDKVISYIKNGTIECPKQYPYLYLPDGKCYNQMGKDIPSAYYIGF